MARKIKTNRASARNPYDTYLSWWFKYARNNEMYSPQGLPFAQPLGYDQFNRRYNQLKRANITNPARTVAMESRVATESQLRNTFAAIQRQYSKEEQKELFGKELKLKDVRKDYSLYFDEIFGELSHDEKTEIMSPKEMVIQAA